MLTVTPDLGPITALCDHEQYRRLADRSAAGVVMAGFDEELLEERGIPPEAVDPLGALLLEPGTLEALGVAEADLVSVRLTEQGLMVERVTAVPQGPAVAERLAATLDADEPVSPVSSDDQPLNTLSHKIRKRGCLVRWARVGDASVMSTISPHKEGSVRAQRSSLARDPG
jgi:hypothetical protein